MIRVYEYPNCSTCKKAIQFLDDQGISYEKKNIVTHPPSRSELMSVLRSIQSDGGTIKKLFNTSGQLYRELKMSEKLSAGMTETQAIDLLEKHGMLIKRPVLLVDKKSTVGFKPDVWKSLLTVRA